MTYYFRQFWVNYQLIIDNNQMSVLFKDRTKWVQISKLYEQLDFGNEYTEGFYHYYFEYTVKSQVLHFID